MKGTLFDNHNRPLNYLRLAVTDRCNLRCFYCMPESGIRYMAKKELLTFEEIERLITILASLGISKVRLTGGEPFLRKDLMDLLTRITEIAGIKDVHLTTNGVLTAPHVKDLKKIGIASVNLSLDTLDADRFKMITRRDEFQPVMDTLTALLDNDIPTKINTVVMQGKNTEDIQSIAMITRDAPVEVRFIEEMPFNGEGSHYQRLDWTHVKIEQHLKALFPDMRKLPPHAGATAATYAIPGHRGRLGIIAAFSRTFCGTCNRIRVTAQGTLKTCLYDSGVLDIRELLRSSADDALIIAHLLRAFHARPANGFEAEQHRKNNYPVSESMSTIGG